MPDRLVFPLLAPLLLAQGAWVRWRTPRLPEPPGPRQGEAGAGPPVRLLILGDSAAAGVGAAHQNEALSGRLVESLASTHHVSWVLEAKTGATTASTLRRLQRMEPAETDVVVTALGVNDVVAGVALPVWLEQQRRLRSEFRGFLGSPHWILSALPPVHAFPALPQPLRMVLGRRARRFDRALREDVASDPKVTHLALDAPFEQRMMAVDGFHPGPPAYRLWGEKAAGRIREIVATRETEEA